LGLPHGMSINFDLWAFHKL